MLRRIALLLSALALVTCTPSADNGAPQDREGPYIAVYSVRDDYLVPQFRPLPDGDPVRGIFELLARDPSGELLHTDVPPEAELLQEAEPDEGRLVLDLNDAFWDGTQDEVLTRVAQVVFTMAGLEEGRAITLLEGAAPARIAGPNGRPLVQPLRAADFPGPAPLVQVVQPVPGATVPRDIPVLLDIPKGVRAWGIVSIDEVLGGKQRLPKGEGVLESGIDGTRDAKVVFVVLRGSDRVSVTVPVTVSS